MKNYIKIQIIFLFMTISSLNIWAQSTNFRGKYRLTSLATGYCLDGNDEKIYPMRSNGGNYQKWYLRPTTTIVNNHRAYTLTSVGTNKFLDGDASKIYPFNRNGGNYQKWIVIPSDVSGYFILKSVATSKVLDGSDKDIYPFDQNNGSYQKWKIEFVN